MNIIKNRYLYFLISLLVIIPGLIFMIINWVNLGTPIPSWVSTLPAAPCWKSSSPEPAQRLLKFRMPLSSSLPILTR